MPDLGPAELIIILLVCLLVFGGSRVAELGGSLGKGIKEFRSAMKEEDTPADAQVPEEPVTAVLATVAKCSRCGTENAAGAKFCSECGEPLSEAGGS